MEYKFNEKTSEYYNGDYIPVFQSDKYKEAKKKAVELIENEKYKGVITEADFWILMNTTKAKDKMQYTGLIISHNVSTHNVFIHIPMIELFSFNVNKSKCIWSPMTGN